jgi:hypothetical protein
VISLEAFAQRGQVWAETVKIVAPTSEECKAYDDSTMMLCADLTAEELIHAIIDIYTVLHRRNDRLAHSTLAIIARELHPS